MDLAHRWGFWPRRRRPTFFAAFHISICQLLAQRELYTEQSAPVMITLATINYCQYALCETGCRAESTLPARWGSLIPIFFSHRCTNAGSRSARKGGRRNSNHCQLLLLHRSCVCRVRMQCAGDRINIAKQFKLQNALWTATADAPMKNEKSLANLASKSA